ncbi:cholesterol oxidase substrate-binding domain-containing protein [Streptomyces spongiae]|uniref:cholesterol oxidase substrate-binding domain-containing protein n=1 Tax=Streptomyces spongiae TaxID=565072 RepID=UPI002AD5655D|nr:cholesterol oxidase substrate-binding domain-containing protein [Streptomyces spongiae]
MTEPSKSDPRAAWSRRGFLLTAASLAAGPQFVLQDRAAAAAELPGFPEGVEVYRSAYRNWVGEITADGLWACAPADADEVVAVVNWARRQGWTVRARGASHGWSPLTVPAGAEPGAPVLLVDTTRHLTGLTIEADEPAAVRAGAGATLEALLTFLEGQGLGVTAAPAVGVLTVGGALAVDAHGTSVPARGERPLPGHTYGSLSNLVLSLTAVVWDADSDAYVLRTYGRDDADGAALLTHLGRALVTEVVLRVGANTSLRCVSRTDLSAAELFAEPGGRRTFASFLDEAGRVEAIWFPFTEFPWLKVWSVAPRRPLTSRRVTSPYNYPFSDSLPTPVADLVGRMVTEGAWYLAPVLGEAQFGAAALGLTATRSADIWGPSKNTLLYLRPTTLRIATDGYAVLTSREQVQRVIAEFTAFYRERIGAYAARGSFPVNGMVEIRVSGLDDPSAAGVEGARAPLLSALRPRGDRPDWDTAVWLNVLTLPGTPDAEAFYRELERFVLDTYDGGHALARVEWSKGWAYTDAAAWSDGDVLGGAVPASFDDSGGDGESRSAWDEAGEILDRLDPHGVFRNPLLDRLFP